MLFIMFYAENNELFRLHSFKHTTKQKQIRCPQNYGQTNNSIPTDKQGQAFLRKT